MNQEVQRGSCNSRFYGLLTREWHAFIFPIGCVEGALFMPNVLCGRGGRSGCIQVLLYWWRTCGRAYAKTPRCMVSLFEMVSNPELVAWAPTVRALATTISTVIVNSMTLLLRYHCQICNSVRFLLSYTRPQKRSAKHVNQVRIAAIVQYGISSPSLTRKHHISITSTETRIPETFLPTSRYWSLHYSSVSDQMAAEIHSFPHGENVSRATRNSRGEPIDAHFCFWSQWGEMAGIWYSLQCSALHHPISSCAFLSILKFRRNKSKKIFLRTSWQPRTAEKWHTDWSW